MRRLLFAAALAIAALAPPAAAQTEAAEQMMLGAMDRLARNHGENVRDYSFTLVYGTTRIPVYVHRVEGEWEVETPPEPAIAEMLSAAVLWPALATLPAEEDGHEMEEMAFRMERDTVEGRPAHVIFVAFAQTSMMGESLPDSMRLYVDEASSQVVRLEGSTNVQPDEEDGPPFGQGGRATIRVDLADYEETDGLTIPRRLRLQMQMELGGDDKQIQSLREDVANARQMLAGDTSPEGQEMRVMMEVLDEMLSERGMDLPMTVQDLRVNAGRPSWQRVRGKG